MALSAAGTSLPSTAVDAIDTAQLKQLADIVNDTDEIYTIEQQAQARGVLLKAAVSAPISNADWNDVIGPAVFRSGISRKVQALQASEQAAIVGRRDSVRAQAHLDWFNSLSADDQQLYFLTQVKYDFNHTQSFSSVDTLKAGLAARVQLNRTLESWMQSGVLAADDPRHTPDPAIAAVLAWVTAPPNDQWLAGVQAALASAGAVSSRPANPVSRSPPAQAAVIAQAVTTSGTDSMGAASQELKTLDDILALMMKAKDDWVAALSNAGSGAAPPPTDTALDPLA